MEIWDHGKLTVNKAFASLFRQRGWETFASIWVETANAAVAKKMRTDRITLSFTLDDHGTQRTFFIKRHIRSSWKEYIKPLLRLTWPILGARNEWNAILHFHDADIPTMTPVAIGESGENSFLITEGLDNCTKLSRLGGLDDRRDPETIKRRRRIIDEVARIARTMHAAGLHHQDFYLGHLMISQSAPGRIYVIDLGRVQKHSTLARRWIVKDLAQLDFSADTTLTEQRRFLRQYLGRPLSRADRRLIRQIRLKRAAIAQHSNKNKL
jgi:heptose I phosphotransferase